MPSRNWTLIWPPGAIGVPTVTVPVESVELKAPPFGCAGGSSSVVCCTVQVLAGQAGFGPVIVTTAGTAGVGLDVRARRSAKPEGTGNVVWSMMRKRRRVTGDPVLFVIV